MFLRFFLSTLKSERAILAFLVLCGGPQFVVGRELNTEEEEKAHKKF